MKPLSLQWMEEQLLRLSGAQFKVAAYLYRRLQRKPELTIRTQDLAEVAGVSPRTTQTAVKKLAKLKIFAITGGPGVTKTYRLPARASKSRRSNKSPSAQPAPAPAQPTIKSAAKKKVKTVPLPVVPSEPWSFERVFDESDPE